MRLICELSLEARIECLLESDQHSSYGLPTTVDTYHERIMIAGLQKSGSSHKRTELRKLQVDLDAGWCRIKILHSEQRVAVGRSENERERWKRETGERHLGELYGLNGDRIIEKKYISSL